MQFLVLSMIPHSLYMLYEVYTPDTVMNRHATHTWGYFNLTLLLGIWLAIGISQVPFTQHYSLPCVMSLVGQTMSLLTLCRIFVSLMYNGWKKGEHQTMLSATFNRRHDDERSNTRSIQMHWTTQLFYKFGFDSEDEEGSIINGIT